AHHDRQCAADDPGRPSVLPRSERHRMGTAVRRLPARQPPAPSLVHLPVQAVLGRPERRPLGRPLISERKHHMHYSPMSLSRQTRRVAGVATAGVLAVAGLTACTAQNNATPECPDGVTEITISGPNQWTSSGSTFGTAWEDLVASFEAVEQCTSVKTNVLPLDSYYQTLSTQLAAGSATDLVFSAATYEPYMVYSLTDDLQQPNPYI